MPVGLGTPLCAFGSERNINTAHHGDIAGRENVFKLPKTAGPTGRNWDVGQRTQAQFTIKSSLFISQKYIFLKRKLLKLKCHG